MLSSKKYLRNLQALRKLLETSKGSEITRVKIMSGPEEIRIKRIVEEVCRILSLNPADIYIKIPEEVSSSDDEAFEQIKNILLKEFIADINSKLVLPLTTLQKLFKDGKVEPRIVGLAVNDFAKALELLNKLNDHLE